MKEAIQYIIRFLLGEYVTGELEHFIGYTSDENEFEKYKIVILRSNFFDNGVYGTSLSLPTLPLQIWEETPILFGEPATEQIGDTLVVKADIVASTYFLISRYEEMVRTDVRDVHGRFPGKESLPNKAKFIDSPIVDEYGLLLRNQLRSVGVHIDEPVRKLKKIYLTHDLDQLAHYRNPRGFVGALLRAMQFPHEAQKALRSFFYGLSNDPWYTFPWLYEQDNILRNALGTKRCEIILFIRSGGSIRKEDAPILLTRTPDFQSLMKLSRKNRVTFGLHASYEAGIIPSEVRTEKRLLKRIVKRKILYNRNHYLANREPKDMTSLIGAGITDDFTMGYADVAGFRLGTCRAVRWINPHTRVLTNLTLHPLTIMDISISDKRYMYLNAFDAFAYCTRLIDMIEHWSGEVTLLWHNTTVEENPKSYHRDLYLKLIEYLKTK